MGTAIDPILDPASERLALFPIRHDDIWEAYRRQENSFWVASEVQLSDDWPHWQSLKEEEQYFIKHILAFFAVADSVVMQNLAVNFQAEVQYPEAKHVYAVSNLMEAIHAETYSILLDFFVRDREERDRLLNAVETVPAIAKKVRWAQQWMNKDQPFAKRILAFACVEGISFSGSFAAIFWLKKRGLMPGFAFSNAKIAQDESAHRDFACLLYRDHLRLHKPSRAQLEALVREAVDNECEFMTDALPCALIGMNAAQMCEYIRFVADHLLVSLGEDKLYDARNPFDWMETISLQPKENFFENSVSQYSLPDRSGGFKLDEDF